ncbi:MAG TPA: sigma-70 family RNA polymerase sigma factor [Stellaceae bacterium]|nr:sigma-70 family RNA polymerase sigma factor [Stellaceae bacterium]
MTDEELMARVAAGDQAAFGELVERHRHAVMRLAYGIVRDAAESEDIVQETFTRMWLKASSWRAGAGNGVMPWLARIAINLAVDRKRRAAPAPLEEAGEVAAQEPDAEARASGRQIGRRIRDAVARLPERQRLAFALCQIERVSNAAAAGVLGVSLGALELLLVRARKTMRRELADLTERG